MKTFDLAEQRSRGMPKTSEGDVNRVESLINKYNCDPKGLWYSVVDVCTCLVMWLWLNCKNSFCQQKFASDLPRIGRNLVYT